MIPSFLAVCISAALPYSMTLGDQVTHGTVVYRTPPHCSAGILPDRQGPPAPAAVAPEAKSAAAATPTKAKPKKAARKPCKKGRTRNSRGVCGRW
jgi:hypothetical protein